jgi:uncharacterized protein (DUF2062 family)
MPKDLIKKYLPDPEKLKQNKSLAFLGDVIHDPNLWHLNRHSVTKAVAIGLFWGCMPMPMQMVAAAFFAIWLNANMPLSVCIVWFSNPITMPPIFYFEYLIGAWLMDTPPIGFEYELSVAWFEEKLVEIGAPLLLGAVFCGLIVSAIGYFTVAFLWRRNVIHRWRNRKSTRKSKNKKPEPTKLN